jgi:hypothetical protein
VDFSGLLFCLGRRASSICMAVEEDGCAAMEATYPSAGISHRPLLSIGNSGITIEVVFDSCWNQPVSRFHPCFVWQVAPKAPIPLVSFYPFSFVPRK